MYRFNPLFILHSKKSLPALSKALERVFPIIGFLILLLFSTGVFSQNLALSISSNGTYVMPHHKKMTHLNQKHFLFTEIAALSRPPGNKYWHHLYNYPQYGLAFHYNPFGNTAPLGKAFALYPFIYNTFTDKQYFSMGLRYGAGLAWLTNKFDPDHNPANVAISTHLNICVNMALEFRQHLSPNLSLKEAIGVNHYSNGALRMPNTGINLPYVSMGLNYVIKKCDKPKPIQPNDSIQSPKYSFSAFAACGLREIYPPCGDLFPAYSFSAGAHVRASPKRSFSLAADAFYSNASSETLKRKALPNSPLNGFKTGLSIGHTLHFDRTSFLFYTGYYIFNKDDTDGRIYNRVGFRYNVNKNIFLNLTLKSHLFVADYIEWGIGFRP